MNEYIKRARLFLEQEQIDYLLVNSTNEFLVEYNDLQRNSRYFLTGFSGSTGDALVSKDNVYLFVDGRYHIQADLEVNHEDITVVKLKQNPFIEELVAKIPDNTVLGICSKKVSQYRYSGLQEKLKNKNVKIKTFDFDIIENKINANSQNLTEIPLNLSGLSSDEKIEKLSSKLKDNEALLVTNLEELSYIYNLRNFNKENSSSIEGKAVITKNKAVLFKDENLSQFENYIKSLSDIETIYADNTSTNVYDYA